MMKCGDKETCPVFRYFILQMKITNLQNRKKGIRGEIGCYCAMFNMSLEVLLQGM